MSKAQFTMERRNALARERGYRSYAHQRKVGRTVSNKRDLDALPADAQEMRARSLDAVAWARREGVPLSKAAARFDVSPQAVAWWTEGAVSGRGRTQAVADGDRLYRPMFIYSAGRHVDVEVRGSRKASLVGAYHAAVSKYLSTGDDAALARFRGKSVDGVEFETDLDMLDVLARQGEFSFESIYRMAS